MTTPVIDVGPELDDAIAEIARLERRFDKLGYLYAQKCDGLRRAGEALLELQHVHPDLAGEIDTIRRYIWPSTEEEAT